MVTNYQEMLVNHSKNQVLYFDKLKIFFLPVLSCFFNFLNYFFLEEAASDDNTADDDKDDDSNGQYHDWANDENSNDCDDDYDD